MIFNFRVSEFGNKWYIDSNSTFDEVLVATWQRLQHEGVFRYRLSVRSTKELKGVESGAHPFILQLNPERASERRKPENLMSLKQEFNPERFHFNKIPDLEHIMELRDTDNNGTSRDLVLINNSPICFGHSLICPNIEDCLPQVITLRSLLLMIHIMFLSNNRYLRVGFNSLCAMASVNHLHYHIIILEYDLPVQKVKCYHLKGPVYTIEDSYPAKGFCFQLKNKEEILKVAEDVYKLTSYLTNNNIGHNLYTMRGESLDGSPKEVLRIFVWARTNTEGVKEINSFNVAVCEFSGHFCVKNEEEFNISVEKLSSLLDKATRETYESIVDEVANLFS